MLSALTARATPIERGSHNSAGGSPQLSTTTHGSSKTSVQTTSDFPSPDSHNLRQRSAPLVEALEKIHNIAHDAGRIIDAIIRESPTLMGRLTYPDYNVYIEHLNAVSKRARMLVEASRPYEASSASDGSHTSPHPPPSSNAALAVTNIPLLKKWDKVVSDASLVYQYSRTISDASDLRRKVGLFQSACLVANSFIGSVYSEEN
ncbi:hypothetical protein H0H93_009956 [Arthromyces matolae]|nr:hypothetical protein H0H93_009956 [Arthromyces matolae]